MKAIVIEKYGSPDVLQFKEIETPTPGEYDVLVKVHAAATNAADWHIMRGAPFIARFSLGFPKPKNTGFGIDFSGQVEAVGSKVTAFQPGDDVFGDAGQGAFAEYVCVNEEKLVHKPDNASYEAAATLGVAALTALQGLRDAGHIQAGQSVLINGASGGVGTFAVQIAKAFGAEVTGVCSSSKLEQTRHLGADHVIDYTQEDFTKSGLHYDLIFDVAANHTMAAYARVLKPQGKYVMVGFSSMGHLLFQVVLLGSLRSRKAGKQFGMMKTAHSTQADLQIIQELFEAGKINPIIDKCYPLSETADAIRHLEEGHARGKIVITVA